MKRWLWLLLVLVPSWAWADIELKESYKLGESVIATVTSTGIPENAIIRGLLTLVGLNKSTVVQQGSEYMIWAEPGVFVAQLPGADDAIRAASAEGWVTVLFVVIVLASFGTLGYLVKQTMKEAREREERASARIGQLEDFIRMKLMESLESNSIVMQKILAAAESICEAANEMSSAIAHCRLAGSQLDQRVAQRPDA